MPGQSALVEIVEEDLSCLKPELAESSLLPSSLNLYVSKERYDLCKMGCSWQLLPLTWRSPVCARLSH